MMATVYLVGGLVFTFGKIKPLLSASWNFKRIVLLECLGVLLALLLTLPMTQTEPCNEACGESILGGAIAVLIVRHFVVWASLRRAFRLTRFAATYSKLTFELVIIGSFLATGLLLYVLALAPAFALLELTRFRSVM